MALPMSLSMDKGAFIFVSIRALTNAEAMKMTVLIFSSIPRRIRKNLLPFDFPRCFFNAKVVLKGCFGSSNAASL